MDNIYNKLKNIKTIDDMRDILKYSKPEEMFTKGTIINALNKMDTDYSYKLTKNIGEIDNPNFEPFLSPKDMLRYGIFEGKYLNDCILEFPREWFEDALNANTLSPGGSNINCNYFKIKSRMSRQNWIEKGWIPQIKDDPDNRGWFQWYCRYYIGRRIPELDEVQIKRWKAFKRHYGQVKKNCNELNCRPRQRQALLQWGYNAFVI